MPAYLIIEQETQARQPAGGRRIEMRVVGLWKKGMGSIIDNSKNLHSERRWFGLRWSGGRPFCPCAI